MTGAKVISETSGDYTNINATYLGTRKSMTTTSTKPSLYLMISRTLRKKRPSVDSKRVERPENKMDRWHLEDRLSKLAGGVATIMVSGNWKWDAREKDRVDDSIHATRAALQEGIAAGGKSHCTMRTKKFPTSPRSNDLSYVIGWNIMVDALPKVWSVLQQMV